MLSCPRRHSGTGGVVNLSAKSDPFELRDWRREQVALLYHVASLGYLQGLQHRVRALMVDVDPTLATLQGRDAIATDARWRRWNTSNKWSGNRWAFLAQFELSITGDIARRAFDTYSKTGVYQCARGMAECADELTIDGDPDAFQARFEQIHDYAGAIDDTMDQQGLAGRWSDFDLALRRHAFPDALTQAPTLRVLPDGIGRTGMLTARTGVYVPVDDPHGAPQFCWTGPPAGKLLECQTFNRLGLMALAEVGRADLWINGERMHAFVQAHLTDPLLTRDAFYADSVADRDLAASLVARNAFTSRACEWLYVEQVDAELLLP
jgi:hypothetical protein